MANITLRVVVIQTLFAPEVMGACCILHNVCSTEGDILKEEEEEKEVREGFGADDRDDSSDEEDVGDVGERELSGESFRAMRFGAYMSNPAEVLACLSKHDYISRENLSLPLDHSCCKRL